MGPLDHLDVTAAQLGKLVNGFVWKHWVDAEPTLGGLRTLADLRRLRGAEADVLLGALLRIAAKDGGDDELAVRAVAFQMEAEALAIANELRDLGPDYDQIVMSSLWMEIRAFPSRGRQRAFATHLRRNTRKSALRALLVRPEHLPRQVLRRPEDFEAGLVKGVLPGSPGTTAAQSRMELIGYLRWCVRTQRIPEADAVLLLDLVAAAWETAGKGVLKLRRGVCSMHAVEVVAEARGVSPKTVVRHRDRVLRSLREAKNDYFVDGVA